MHKSLIVMALALLGGASAYASGPYDGKGVPERWGLAGGKEVSATAATAVEETAWWTRFGDPLLDSLVATGLSANYDMAMATRRIDMARAAVGQARAAYFPQIGLSASYTRGRNSGRQMSRHGEPTDIGYFNVGAQLSWEIDVFGKIRSRVKEGEANVRVSRAERAGVETALAAEIADAYVNLRVMQAELDVARQHALRQDTALRIAEARHEVGLASMMDVEQARQVYYTTIAQIPLLEGHIHNGVNAISVLLAAPADSLRAVLEPRRALPGYVQLVEAGTPAEMIRRRPDVRQAEHQIDVAAAQLGIARKDWLPTLSVSAEAGTVAHNGGDLFSGKSFSWTVAPTLSWTLFDGLSRRYATQSAKDALRNAVDNYNLAVLTAVQEADNAMSNYLTELRYIDSLEKLVEASAGYDRRALSNYKNGLSPYINVADAQMSYLENVNTLIVAKGQALSSLISLYKALGYGQADTEY